MLNEFITYKINPNARCAPWRRLDRVVLRLGLSLQPLVSLRLRHFFGNRVALLQAADELFLASSHECQVVVGELAPLLPGNALHLLPLALHLIPIRSEERRVGKERRSPRS